jgi:HAD superfamily hydrolase (TIGR01549 family)
MVTGVVFDVGETLVDDTREWRAWADWLGVPAHTVSALVGAVTVQGMDNVEALRLIKPGFSLAAERAAREEAGRGERIEEADLYPDVRSALSALQRAGLWVGIAGNQTSRAAELLGVLDLPADGIATSGEWGIAKPDPRFFAHLIDWAPGDPHDLVYVGDHCAHDIVPAKAAGLRTALIRRGPWGHLRADDPQCPADWRIRSLNELLDLFKRA